MPVVAEIAPDYVDEVAFVAVAGRSGLEATAARAEELFGDRLAWGLDDDLWETFDVPYQPVTVLIADGVEIDRWAGALGEDELRRRLDAAVQLHEGAAAG